MPIEAPKGFDNLRNNLAETQTAGSPKPDLTEEQRKEIEVQGTALLKTLMRVANPFMVYEGFNQKEERSFVATYITPPVPIQRDETDAKTESTAENKEPTSPVPYYFALVETKRYIDLFIGGDDRIGEETVKAGIFIQIPENENPVPFVIVEGKEIKAGEVTATKVETFRFTGEEQAPDQLEEIRDAQKTADAMKEYFDANPNVGITVNDKAGHVVSYKSADKEFAVIIPKNKLDNISQKS